MNPLASSLRSFLFGLTVPPRAAALIARKPALLGASLIPLCLTIALDAWLIHRIQTALGDWIHGHVPGTIEWVALLLSWIALFIAGVLAFTFIAGIAALPFNDWLAELTESRTQPPLPSAGPLSWKARLLHLMIDLFKTVCALFLSLLALVLSWIPGLNLVGVVLMFLLIAFQFLSYPQTRRSEGVLDGFKFIGVHFWSCLGFGMSFALLFALPLVSSLALPLAVVGGTLLYARARHLEAAKTAATLKTP